MSHQLTPKTRINILLRGMEESLDQGILAKNQPIGTEITINIVIEPHASELVLMTL